MSEEPKPWDRQPNEPLTWYKRFTAFRLMEPIHSIPEVFQQEESTKNHEKPRTKPPGDWYAVAKVWHWEARAAAWDAFNDQEIEKTIVAEKKKVFRTHYALMHKRIEQLDAIATRLIGYLEDEKNVWLPDVKAIGTGEHAYQVDIVRFNAPLFGEIRAYLTDIAAEKSERLKKSQTDIFFPPDVYEGIGPNDDGSVK